MRKGFMYLTAIIDVYSRFIVGWQISNTLEKQTQTQTEVLAAAIERYGAPEIVNSDQGSQYTSEHWVNFLKGSKIKIGMDGKGRATDNAFIERWFRTVKQKHIYLNPAENGTDLFLGILSFVEKYNTRNHNGFDLKSQLTYLKNQRYNHWRVRLRPTGKNWVLSRNSASCSSY
jgi:putative transposase